MAANKNATLKKQKQELRNGQELTKSEDKSQGITFDDDFPTRIDSEVNTLKYPFFALTTKGLKKIKKVEYKETEITDQGTFERLWQVTANVEFGFPGPFDRKVFRAIESIINELPKPIENPIPFTLYNLCKRIGINTSGTNKEMIKNSIKRIAKSAVNAKGTFYSKEMRKYFVDKDFHLYDIIVFTGQELPDGKIADKNYIFLNNIYLSSINSFYVKPLDYKYMYSLRSTIAERCYELLGIKFYGMSEKQTCIRYLYSTLCKLLPVTRCRFYSKARSSLQQAFDELTDTGFFMREPVWEKTERKDDWYIYFWPGKRALEERRNQFGTYHIVLTGGEPLTVEERAALPAVLPESDERSSVQEKAAKWVMYFYQTLFQSEKKNFEIHQNDLALATKYLELYGESVVKVIIDDTIAYAKESNWDIRFFGSIKCQVEKTLAQLEEREKQQKLREQEDEKRKDLYEKQNLYGSYVRFVDDEIERMKAGPQAARLQQLLADEARRHFGEVSGKMIDKNPTMKDILRSLVKRRLEAEGLVPGFDEWRAQYHDHGKE